MYSERHDKLSAVVLDSQSASQGIPCPAQRLRCRQEDWRSQASYRCRHGGSSVNDQSDLADISDAAGAQKVLEAVRQCCPWMKPLVADSAYDRAMLMGKAPLLDFVVEVICKMDDQHTFAPLRRRWVMERSFCWMMRWRRLVPDYEERIDVSEEIIYVAMGSLLLKRIFNETWFSNGLLEPYPNRL